MAIEVVQSEAINIEDDGLASISCSFPSNVTAGNTIVAFVRGNEWVSLSSIEDSLSNSYSLGAIGGETQQVGVGYSTNIKGGSCTVTVSFTEVQYYKTLCIIELSGVDKDYPFIDAKVSSTSINPDGGTDSLWTAEVSALSGGIVLGMVTNTWDVWSDLTAGTGMTWVDGVAWRMGVEKKSITADGWYSAPWTSSSTHGYNYVIISFRGTIDKSRINYIQSEGASGGGGAPYKITATLSSNITMGNHLIVIAFDGAGIASVADNRGNTFTQRASYTTEEDSVIRIYDALITNAGSCTVTLTGTSNAWRTLWVGEYTSVNSYVDSKCSNDWLAASTEHESASINTAYNDALVLGAIWLENGEIEDGISPGGSESERYDDWDWFQVEDKIVASATSTKMTWDLTEEDGAICLAVVYRPIEDTPPVQKSHVQCIIIS